MATFKILVLLLIQSWTLFYILNAFSTL